MPLEVRDAGFLWDMLEAAREARDYVKGRTFDDYLHDPMLRRAVERTIEIIGEAARHVSKTVQEEHPEIRWRGIIVQRHVLAHEYGEIKQERIWAVATVHIPALILLLEPLVPPPPPDSLSG